MSGPEPEPTPGHGDGLHAEASERAQQAVQHHGVQYNTWYAAPGADTASAALTAGAAALRAGQYQAAVAQLEKAVADPEIAEEVRFHLAVALFNGARPGLSKRAVVRRAEREIERVLQRGPRHAPALFLWAIVKEDYYLAGGFDIAPPGPADLVRAALPVLAPAADTAALIIDHVPTPASPAWCLLRAHVGKP